MCGRTLLARYVRSCDLIHCDPLHSPGHLPPISIHFPDAALPSPAPRLHAPLIERNAFYETVDQTLAPAGRCVIDVPVEVGPSLLIKHLGRRLLKGRPAEVSRDELVNRAVGRTAFDPARFDPTTNEWIHFHNGCDYRILAQELRGRFELLCSFGTPCGTYRQCSESILCCGQVVALG